MGQILHRSATAKAALPFLHGFIANVISLKGSSINSGNSGQLPHAMTETLKSSSLL